MPATTDDDKLDEIIADYIESTAKADSNSAPNSSIAEIRTDYLRMHADLAAALQDYFDDEDTLRSKVAEPLLRPPEIERYQSMTLIGNGAMGIVYRAFDGQLQRWVALKMAQKIGQHTQAEQAHFRHEAQAMARLRHPHIVSVFDTGNYEGQAYLSMDLIDGASLDSELAYFLGDQHSIAHLMIDIARAVHHAHQREILHRDLKPANIIITRDQQAKPFAYVCDFGLAKPLIDKHQPRTRANGAKQGPVEGTACYMSPEQAQGEYATTLSDVYGLGAILYSLLTGAPPFRGHTLESTLKLVSDPLSTVNPPSAGNNDLDPSLEAICLKSLRHEPGERYASAEGMARDLERWLSQRMTEARPLRSFNRMTLWCRRNPVGTGLITMALALLTLVGHEIRQQLDEPRQAQLALAANRADTLALRLAQLRQAVAATANNPRLPSLFATQDSHGLQALIDEAGRKRVDLNGISPFESWFALTMSDGHILARWPSLSARAGELDLRSRDYITGLQRLNDDGDSRHVRVSRVFRSLIDGLYKFGVSAPIYSNQGIPIGAIVATVTTSAQMGFGKRMGDSIVTALLARREVSNRFDRSSHPKDASDYLILLHPAYQRRTEPVWLPAHALPALGKGIDDSYRDPVRSLNRRTQQQFGGTWTAVFAPVPNSEFIVIVQQQQTRLLPPQKHWITIGIAVGMVILLALLIARFTMNRSTPGIR